MMAGELERELNRYVEITHVEGRTEGNGNVAVTRDENGIWLRTGYMEDGSRKTIHWVSVCLNKEQAAVVGRALLALSSPTPQ